MYKKLFRALSFLLLFNGFVFAQNEEPIVEENGSFREVYYLGSDGFKTGPYVKYLLRQGRSDLVIERGDISGGERNGLWESLGGKGLYKDGQKVGLWVYRLPNGRMAQKFDYSTGEVPVRGRISPFRNYRIHFADGSSEEKIPAEIPIPVGGEVTIMYADLLLEYPEAGRRDALSGEVVVHVVIDSSGERISAQIKSSLGAIFDDEAIRYVELLDRWVPGRDGDSPVKVSFDLPVFFRVQ